MFASSRVRTISSTVSFAAPSSDMHRLDDVLDAREHRVLERARRGDDPVARGDPLHRRAQVAPRRLLHARGDLGAEATRERPLLGGHERAGPRDGLEHRVELHRDELGERDHLAEDLVLEDELGHRVEHDREHPAVRDDRRRALGEVGRRERQRRDTGRSISRTASSPMCPSSGRRIVRPYSSLFSMKNTGRSSSTAAASSAPTSWHSLAATTHDVRDAEEELLERLRVRRAVAAPRRPSARARRAAP